MLGQEMLLLESCLLLNTTLNALSARASRMLAITSPSAFNKIRPLRKDASSLGCRGTPFGPLVFERHDFGKPLFERCAEQRENQLERYSLDWNTHKQQRHFLVQLLVSYKDVEQCS